MDKRGLRVEEFFLSLLPFSKRRERILSRSPLCVFSIIVDNISPFFSLCTCVVCVCCSSRSKFPCGMYENAQSRARQREAALSPLFLFAPPEFARLCVSIYVRRWDKGVFFLCRWGYFEIFSRIEFSGFWRVYIDTAER